MSQRLFTAPTQLLLRTQTGNYHVDVNADESGTWFYRFESTGTGQAADEGTFEVSESHF
jgi:hypothetical protein